MDEKRLHKRIKKSIKCEVYSDGLTFSSTIDVSNGGMFISTPEPLLENSEIELILHIPEGESIELKATVKWVRDEDADSRSGMGVQFLNITPQQQDTLDSFVES